MTRESQLFRCFSCYGEERDTANKQLFWGDIQRGDHVHSFIPMRFSCDIYPARYLSTLLSQKNSNDTNPTILPSTGLSVLHLGKSYLTTVLNPSLCNLSPFSFILANNPSQIRRINYCFLFALFITCLKSIIYRFTAFKLLEV